MLEILLIRHAKTEYNDCKKFTGITDVELSSEGRRQVLALTNRLKDEVLDHIYSSDLKRCIETGEHINCAGGRTFTEDLREMKFGRWEGLTYQEIKNKYPDELESWEKNWDDYVIQEGESVNIMSGRVIRSFEEIVKKHKSDHNPSDERKIAIVSHSGCIRSILAHCIIGSVRESWKFRIENATVSRLRVDNDYYYLKSLNEA